jgi:hypothetical protein
MNTFEESSQSPTELFIDEPGAFDVFHDLALALDQDPSVFTRPNAENLNELRLAVAFLAGYLMKDMLLKGQDFMARECLPSEAENWLYSQDHLHLIKLGTKNGVSRFGRLGAVIALHPRRDEIAALITPDFFDNPDTFRFLPHVSRLLTHENAPSCENFAMDVLRHPEFYGKIPSSRDGSDAFIYWTYGPYVLEGLKRKGKQYADMVQTWLTKRKQSEEYRGNARYPGIDYMYEAPYARMHYLAKEGQDPSHVFVKFITDKAIIPQIAR